MSTGPNYHEADEVFLDQLDKLSKSGKYTVKLVDRTKSPVRAKVE